MRYLVTAGSLVDDSIITWEVTAQSMAEAERIAVQGARRSDTADSGNVSVEQLDDDFGLVLEKLEEVLQMTKDLQDLSTLLWKPEKKTVEASFYYDFDPIIIPITSDTAAGMIKEVMTALLEK